jgi:hypothetical protein
VRGRTHRPVAAAIVLSVAIALVTVVAFSVPASATRIGGGFTLEETTIAKIHRAMRAEGITCRTG